MAGALLCVGFLCQKGLTRRGNYRKLLCVPHFYGSFARVFKQLAKKVYEKNHIKPRLHNHCHIGIDGKSPEQPLGRGSRRHSNQPPF